jgi:DMSO/TMAO reductase YedYZ heme-binding membrane subunit
LASTLAFTIAAVFVCSPVSFAWKQWDGEHKGKCVNNNTLAFTHAAFSILLDFLTLSLPITQIWNLHLAMKKKIGVLLMFSVGALYVLPSHPKGKIPQHPANKSFPA